MRHIPPEQVAKRLVTENPWWASGVIPPPFATWRPRAYLDLVEPLVESHELRRAVVLMGPRRIGKTVLLHHLIGRLLERGVEPRRLCYVSVDHPLYNGLGLEDFLESYQRAAGIENPYEPCWIFFDEVQYLKDWEVHLKVIVDRMPHVRCVASGSAAAALKLKSHESGAGRFTDFLLPPLTFYEYLSLRGLADLVEYDADVKSFPTTPDLEALNAAFLEYVNHGGYPEAIFSPEIRADPHRYIKSDIIDKVLLRDLPGLYGIQDIQELNYLFTTLAFNTAGEVSLEELSRKSGVAKGTIKRYIEYLEAAFLIRIVHRVDRTARRFQRARHFKVYLTNPSIRSALFAPLGADEDMFGSLVETAIFAQWFHRETHLHYARWKKSKGKEEGEVDLVKLGAQQKVDWALEVKWTDRFVDQPGKLTGLLAFCKEHGLRHGWATTRRREARCRIQDVEITFLPAALYCFIAGYWSIRERGLGKDGEPTANRLADELIPPPDPSP